MKNKKGFTLIELIIYIALVSVFIVGATRFSLNIIYGREKTQRQQNVSGNARTALERITFEIKNADSIVNVSPTSLQLNNANLGNITISLSSGRIAIAYGAVNTFLTSNQVNVTSLDFTDLSTGNSKNINVSITIADNEISQIYETSAEIRKP